MVHLILYCTAIIFYIVVNVECLLCSKWNQNVFEYHTFQVMLGFSACITVRSCHMLCSSSNLWRSGQGQQLRFSIEHRHAPDYNTLTVTVNSHAYCQYHMEAFMSSQFTYSTCITSKKADVLYIYICV